MFIDSSPIFSDIYKELSTDVDEIRNNFMDAFDENVT